MSYYVTVAIGMSIIIPGLVALVRFAKISPAFYPFIFCVWLGFIAECVNVTLAHTIRNNWVSTNIYLLAEVLLYTWQFKKWGLYRGIRGIYYFLIAASIGFWIIQVLLITSINQPTLYFLIAAAMIIVLQSIAQMNAVIAREKSNLLRSPVFLICSVFALYFSLRVVINVGWLYGDKIHADFTRFIINTLNYVNLLGNLVFALAIIWMPAKLRFSLPS